MISREDRDARILAVDRDRDLAVAMLEAEIPTHEPISAEQLVEYFRPLFTWGFLKAEAKRRILFSLVPEIRVADYVVSGLGVLVPSSEGFVPNKKPPVGVTQEPGALLLAGDRTLGSYASHRKRAW
jgi:hypothetical protein